MPSAKFGGRPRAVEIREILNAVFYVLRAGCAWRVLPHDFPKWKTVYHYWREWCQDNLGWTLEIVKRPSKWGRYLPGVEPPPMPRFTVLKRRWVVERTIAWLGRNRRTSKDYEFLTQTERIVYLCSDDPLDAEKINKRCRKAMKMTFQTPSKFC